MFLIYHSVVSELQSKNGRKERRRGRKKRRGEEEKELGQGPPKDHPKHFTIFMP